MLLLCCCALGLYMLASYVLLQYPLLLHKKKYPPVWLRSSHLIAHRGGRQDLPENTVEAFTHALAHCDVLELDVWLSADGAVVVFHDDNLGRMTGGTDTRPLPEVRSDNLPLLRPVPSEGWDQGHARDKGKKCYEIPLLQDVFAAVPQTTKFIIEFKFESLELIQKVHELAHAQGRLEHIVWFSLKSSINQQLAAFDPQIPRIMSVSSVFRVTLLFLLGLLPFVQVSDQIFGVKAGPVNIGLLQKMEAFRRCPLSVQQRVAKMVLGLFEYSKRPLSKHLARRGFPCWVLGVNDEAGLREAISVGATGMLTDRPAWLGSVASAGAPRK